MKSNFNLRFYWFRNIMKIIWKFVIKGDNDYCALVELYEGRNLRQAWTFCFWDSVLVRRVDNEWSAFDRSRFLYPNLPREKPHPLGFAHSPIVVVRRLRNVIDPKSRIRHVAYVPLVHHRYSRLLAVRGPSEIVLIRVRSHDRRTIQTKFLPVEKSGRTRKHKGDTVLSDNFLLKKIIRYLHWDYSESLTLRFHKVPLLKVP